MISIILIVAFGILFSFFATLNTAPTTLHLPTDIVYTLPLYLVILIALGIGVLLISLISFVKSVFNRFALSKKDHELSKTKGEAVDLTKRIHQLEIENTKLKTELHEGQDDNSI